MQGHCFLLPFLFTTFQPPSSKRRFFWACQIIFAKTFLGKKIREQNSRTNVSRWEAGLTLSHAFSSFRSEVCSCNMRCWYRQKNQRRSDPNEFQNFESELPLYSLAPFHQSPRPSSASLLFDMPHARLPRDSFEDPPGVPRRGLHAHHCKHCLTHGQWSWVARSAATSASETAYLLACQVLGVAAASTSICCEYY